MIRRRAAGFCAYEVVEVWACDAYADRSEARIRSCLDHGVNHADAVTRILRRQTAGVDFNVTDAEIGQVRGEETRHAFRDRNAVEFVTVIDVVAAANGWFAGISAADRRYARNRVQVLIDRVVKIITARCSVELLSADVIDIRPCVGPY